MEDTRILYIGNIEKGCLKGEKEINEIKIDNKKQTFIIEVVDTQDSTWQGRVSLVNGQKQQTFRSVMELLRLVDSVVGENEKGFIERKTF